MFCLQTSGNETDRRLYRVLKIIKDRCDTKESTVFDPILSASEASSRVQTLIRVEKGVFNGKYTSKPWRFIKHVNEAFNHILTSKSKRCKIHLRTLEVSWEEEKQRTLLMRNFFSSKKLLKTKWTRSWKNWVIVAATGTVRKLKVCPARAINAALYQKVARTSGEF